MRRRGGVAAILIAFAGLLDAAHITDRLLVGLYAEPGQQQPPAELLESGTALDIQEKRNGYVKVRLASGQQGWVEAIYVMEEKPARMRLLEAQASLVKLKQELAAVKQVQPEVPQPVISSVSEPAAILNHEVGSQVKRYWPFVAIVLSLVTGIAVGIGIVDYRLRKQLDEL